MPIGTKPEIDVVVQTQTEPLFQYLLMQELKTDITLTEDVVKDSEEIKVSSDHGFTGAAGEVAVLWENGFYLQARIVSVAVDTITIEIPTALSFTIAGCKVVRGNVNMNVNGSVTPVDFVYKPYNSTIPIDLKAAKISMLHTAVGDLGKFGGLGALDLDEGMYFREENGIQINLGNYTTNQDFENQGAKVSFPDKAPAGTNATLIEFDLQETYDKQIRVIPSLNGQLRACVRGDLSATAGMTSMVMALYGSYTLGEE